MHNPATCKKKFKMWPLANTEIVGRFLTSKSTAMVMLGQSVHLTTLLFFP